MFETFESLQNVYYSLFAVIILNSVYLLFFRDKIKAAHYILFNSFMAVFIAAQLLFFEGMFVDENNLSAGSLTFYLFIAGGFVFLLTLLLYAIRNKKPAQTR